MNCDFELIRMYSQGLTLLRTRPPHDRASPVRVYGRSGLLGSGRGLDGPRQARSQDQRCPSSSLSSRFPWVLQVCSNASNPFSPHYTSSL